MAIKKKKKTVTPAAGEVGSGQAVIKRKTGAVEIQKVEGRGGKGVTISKTPAPSATPTPAPTPEAPKEIDTSGFGPRKELLPAGGEGIQVRQEGTIGGVPEKKSFFPS